MRTLTILLLCSSISFSYAQNYNADALMRKVLQQKDRYGVNNEGFMAYSQDEGTWLKLPKVVHEQLNKEGVRTNVRYQTQTLSEAAIDSTGHIFETILQNRSLNREAPSPLLVCLPNFFAEIVGNRSPSPLHSNNFDSYEYLIQSETEGLITIQIIPKTPQNNLFDGTVSIRKDLSIKNIALHIVQENVDFFWNLALENYRPQYLQLTVKADLMGFAGEYHYELRCEDWTKRDTNNQWQGNLERASIIPPKVTETLNISEVNFEVVQLREVLKNWLQNQRYLWDKRNRHFVVSASRPVTWTYHNNHFVPRRISDSVTFHNFNRLSPFAFNHLIFSRSFFWGKQQVRTAENGTQQVFYPHELYYRSPLLDFNFNTVEGYVANTGLVYRKRWGKYKWAEAESTLRQSLSTGRAMAFGKLRYKTEKTDISFSGGRFVSQINTDNPISFEMNSLGTLFLKNNQMKIFEKEYLNLNVLKRFSSKLFLRFQAEAATRYPLENTQKVAWLNPYTRPYQPNLEANTRFEYHRAFTYGLQLGWRPFLKYRYQNRERLPLWASSPLFNIRMKGNLAGKAQFQHIEISTIHSMPVGRMNHFGYILNVGGFLRKPNYFLDYKHFNGTVQLVQTAEVLASHRLLGFYNNLIQGASQRFQLNQYQYSTNGAYFEAMTLMQFNKLGLTQMSYFRKKGISEVVFFDQTFFANGPIKQYTELGYGLNGLLRVLRLEIGLDFINGQYDTFGLRFNLNTKLRIGSIPD